MTRNVVELIKHELAHRFAPPRGEKTFPGGQREIARRMHLAQPTLNRLIKKGEGVGVDVLLGLRAYFEEEGRAMTLEEILLGGRGRHQSVPKSPSSAPPPRSMFSVKEQKTGRVSRKVTA